LATRRDANLRQVYRLVYIGSGWCLKLRRKKSEKKTWDEGATHGVSTPDYEYVHSSEKKLETCYTFGSFWGRWSIHAALTAIAPSHCRFLRKVESGVGEYACPILPMFPSYFNTM